MLSISLQSELLPLPSAPPLQAPSNNLRALMHASRTARVSARRPQQTGHLFTRRSKSAGRSAGHRRCSVSQPPSPSTPVHSSSRRSIFQQLCVSMRNKRPALWPPQQVKPSGGRDEPQRGERLRGGGRDWGRGGRPPRVNLAPAGRAGAVQSGAAWGLMAVRVCVHREGGDRDGGISNRQWLLFLCILTFLVICKSYCPRPPPSNPPLYSYCAVID